MPDSRAGPIIASLVLCIPILWACQSHSEGPLIPGTATGASREEHTCSGTIVRVTYEEYSGPLPDRYTERYTLTLEGVQFERTGEEAGPVNRGTWVVNPAADAVDALFSELGAVDCSRVNEIAPESPEIGGGETLYKLEYEGGVTFGLWYREGYRYENAELITAPILSFVHGLELPEEAFSTFKFP